MKARSVPVFLTSYFLLQPSDIWSLGCILYQMIYGTTPFAHLSQAYLKCQAIVSSDHEIPFPADADGAALDVMKKCLQRDPAARPPIVGCNGLLTEHPFLNGPSRK
jgi:serine/threonine-protein kinase TTK/MPS1